MDSRLRTAVAAVVTEHPVLSAVPAISGFAEPHFVHLPEIDLAATVLVEKTSGDVDFQRRLATVIEEQHNLAFQLDSTPSKPFWRIYALDDRWRSSQFSVCFCFHHALMDTKSAVVFQHTLEQAMAHVPGGQSPGMVSVPEKALLPSLDELHDLTVSSAFIASQQDGSDPPDNVWSGGVQKLPVQSRVHILWITDAVTRHVMARCKEKRTSVTALLMSLLADSFFQVIPSSFEALYGDCAISTRRFLPDPIDEQSMGCYVSVFREKYHRGAEHSIWDETERTRSTMNAVLAKQGADSPFGYLKLVPDLADWFKQKLGKKRWAAWELSNVGAMPKSEENGDRGPRIESLLFSQSASACSAVVKVSVATGRDGRMGFCFSWQDGAVDEGVVRGVIDRFSQHIHGSLD